MKTTFTGTEFKFTFKSWVDDERVPRFMTCSWSEKRVSETTHKEDDDRETGDFYVHLGKF